MARIRICGIYKITSPSGKVYIGQSRNIKKRWYVYEKEKAYNQIRLHRSFLKYSIEHHIFEIIEKCSIEVLNERERYWQDFYDVIGPNGLNCRLTDPEGSPILFKENIKDSLSNSKKGELNPMFGKKGKLHPWYGRKHTEESKLLMSKALQGRKFSKERRSRMNKNKKGWNSRKLILNTEIGVFYTKEELSSIMNISIYHIKKIIERKHKTITLPLIWC